MAEPTTDAGVGPALGDAGPCPKITFQGKTWTIGHPTQIAKVELELLVIEVAQANIDAFKRRNPAKYEEKCKLLDLQIEGGHHKTGGELWAIVNNGPDGQPLFLASLLKEKHPEVTLDDARGMFRREQRQVRRALALVVPAFFEILADDLPLTPEDREAKRAEMAAEFLTALAEPVAFTASDSSAPTPPSA